MEKVSGFFIVLCFLFILVFARKQEEQNVEANGIIIVGVIDDVYAKGGFVTAYKFTYKSRVYMDSEKGTFRNFNKGKRCYIKFLADNPEKSMLITYKEVPSCLDTVIKTWTTFPNCQ